MRTQRVASIFLLAAFALTIRAVLAGPPIPIEAFGALPQVSEVDLSPNGSLLAWYDESGGRASVVVFDLGKQQYRKKIPIAERAKFRTLGWADDETLLVTLSVFHGVDGPSASSKYEWFRTFATDVSGGQDRMLLRLFPGRGSDGDRLAAYQ